ncbi:hypothetical protein D3C71_2007610 [compost metagenome]
MQIDHNAGAAQIGIIVLALIADSVVASTSVEIVIKSHGEKGVVAVFTVVVAVVGRHVELIVAGTRIHNVIEAGGF